MARGGGGGGGGVGGGGQARVVDEAMGWWKGQTWFLIWHEIEVKSGGVKK